MIYKFKSQAAGDVIMMGPAGDQVLRVIGKQPAASGIIAATAMPAAIAAIEQAVAADEAAGKPSAKGADAGEDERDAGGGGSGGGVSLRQRAWPLVDMMKRSQAGNADIVWGV